MFSLNLQNRAKRIQSKALVQYLHRISYDQNGIRTPSESREKNYGSGQEKY